jgi:small subunit ribosomal protein S4
MARYLGPVCKHCRREGNKLFLKGDRCSTDKCAIERRSYGPGQHGQRRSKPTEYGTQLREKQKLRRIYGVLEAQFHRYFTAAERMRGITGENLLKLLEGRLDNMVYRMGFAASRKAARQLVLHGHFTVNGKKVNIPSCQMKAGDTVSVQAGSRELPAIKNTLEAQVKKGFPTWTEVDAMKYSAVVKEIPGKDDIQLPVKEQLIVELYSK